MKKCFLTSTYLLLTFFGFAQTDTTLLLRIIDQKVCINKNRLLLNFSYYFENHSDENLVVIDYYEPCFWENPAPKNMEDSTKNFAIVLVIRDDSGNVVYPTQKTDTAFVLDREKYNADSSEFYAKYQRENEKEYDHNTRALYPKAVLINLFTMRLNKRKCFHARTFDFDFSRKYSLSLFYLAEEDLRQLANQWVLKQDSKLFVGRIHSNEVQLCFK